jgi:hypothetical protein
MVALVEKQEKMDDKNINGDRIVTRTYSGPNRRVSEKARDEEHTTSVVTHDERGNQILEVRSNASRQRYDDETVNLLKILKIDELALDD